MIVGGETFARIMALLISMSALGVMGALVWSGSRVIVAAAKENYIPGPGFSRLLRQWNPKFNTLVAALIFQYILCSLTILFFWGSDPFKFLINLSVHSSWIYYLLSVIGLLVGFFF